MKDYNEMAESVLKRRDEYNLNRRKRMKRLKKGIAAVGCCCIIGIFGIGIINNGLVASYNPKQKEDDQKEEIADLQSDKAGVEEFAIGKQNEDNTISEEALHNNNLHNNTEDAPADSHGDYMEAVNPNRLSKKIQDFFGGSYMDADGNFVVVLTKDTPKNRALICSDLGIRESNTVFQMGEFTLAYLTELQARISEGMMKKELPFVVSSAVREDINRISITVTTEDKELIQKVLVLDTQMGAIEVNYAEEGGRKDVAELDVLKIQ